MNEFFPVGMVHMIIHDFLVVLRRCLSSRRHNWVQRFPKCFNNFPIHNPCTRYESRSILYKALVFVAMYVEQADGLGNMGETGRQLQIGVVLKSGHHVYQILAHDIIVKHGMPKALCIVLQQLGHAIVNIVLPAQNVSRK